MIHHLTFQRSILDEILIQLRDEQFQANAALFRRNLNRVAMLTGFEISKNLKYSSTETVTTLGVADSFTMTDQIVAGAILRAGLPMHEGMLEIFDDAESVFIAAYRHHHKDGTFDVNLEYIHSPQLENKILILCDPMIATGTTLVKTLEGLQKFGTPREIHVCSVIASVMGLEYVEMQFPEVHIWTAAIDEELTARSYIVPGLGDAGDLAYGEKDDDPSL